MTNLYAWVRANLTPPRADAIVKMDRLPILLQIRVFAQNKNQSYIKGHAMLAILRTISMHKKNSASPAPMAINLITKPNYVQKWLVMLAKYLWHRLKGANARLVLHTNSTRHATNVHKIITSTIINAWLAPMELITIVQQKNVIVMKLADTLIRA